MASNYKRTVLVILAAIVMSLILAVTAGAYINKVNSMMQGENYKFLEDIAEQSASTVSKKLEGDIRMLSGMAVVLGSQDSIDVSHWVDVFGEQDLFQEFQRIGIILSNGKGYGQDVSGTDFSDRDYFKRAMKGETVISNALIDKTTGFISFTYAVPIYQGDQITAIMAAVTNMEEFQKNLLQKPFMSKGYSYLVNSTGDVILSSTNEKAPVFRHLPNEILSGSDYKNSMAARMAIGQTGSLEYRYQDETYFLSYVPIGINEWYIISMLPKTVVQEKSQNILTLTAVACGFVCILFVVYIISIYYMQMRSRKKLFRLAYYDELTGLYNKFGFRRIAPSFLKSDNSYAYCILDIKRFKTINNRFGYAQGDNFLCYIADILRSQCLSGEIYSRFAADTFHLLLFCPSNQILEQRLFDLNEQINQYMFSGDRDFQVHLGFGVYCIGTEGMSLDFMGDMAKLALDQSRELHSTTVHFYNEAIRNQHIEKQDIENHMQRAVINREFIVFMQPKYAVNNGRIASAETLVRWAHPTMGMISPAIFIPLFEKNGFISELDLYMFEELCRIIRCWLDQDIDPVPISINQARMSLFTTDHLDKLLNILHKYDIPPRLIIIEITESAFFNDMEEIETVINKLHHIGFRVSMDDFGSGYSSLNMLQDVFLDELKIDKNFFNLSANLERGRKIVKNIIAMAQDLKIEVVAEGVETEEQVLFLKQAGCQFIQGYYYSKPVPYQEFEKMAYED